MPTNDLFPNAWLETADGSKVRIQGALSLGRSEKNGVVLSDTSASRRHALLNTQQDGEIWLVDLGSANGSRLNGQRIMQPVRLHAGDRIQLGAHTFVFREGDAMRESTDTVATSTTPEFHTEPLWLLVADIEGFTVMSQQLPAARIAVLVGGWFLACQKIVEEHEGRIQKYLGDGILASWRADAASTARVAAAAHAFAAMITTAEPRFRFVIHRGLVAKGGGPMPGEEGIIGSAINFVFRMEKLAAQLGVPALLSDEAREPLAAHLATTPIGSHRLKGFEQTFAFFAPDFAAAPAAL
jgi:adenylate cyclase